MNNTWVIGDLHGALKALKQLFERAPVKEGDTIIFLGDYVDGWSESAELVEFLIQLKESGLYNLIFIKGNHDEWCRKYLVFGQVNHTWQQNGGQVTIDSYIKTGHLVDERHRQFFNDLIPYYIDDQNRGFVHGGFNSKHGLGHDEYESDYYWDRDLWSLCVISNNSWHEGPSSIRRYNQHKEIYIGHTSTTNWKCKTHYREAKDPNQPTINGKIVVPMLRCNVWNLDTGCGWDGRATIMNIETKQYWQSDNVQTLYPDELGRT